VKSHPANVNNVDHIGIVVFIPNATMCIGRHVSEKNVCGNALVTAIEISAGSRLMLVIHEY
jgi:hypothetical protein